MGLHRVVVCAALVAACASPTAPAPPRIEASRSAQMDLQELLATCLQNAWVRSGPHATPQSLALYNHYAALCMAKYARESP